MRSETTANFLSSFYVVAFPVTTSSALHLETITIPVDFPDSRAARAVQSLDNLGYVIQRGGLATRGTAADKKIDTGTGPNRIAGGMLAPIRKSQQKALACV